jgi:hypothetical protein
MNTFNSRLFLVVFGINKCLSINEIYKFNRNCLILIKIVASLQHLYKYFKSLHKTFNQNQPSFFKLKQQMLMKKN